jgi:diguanylate cyclase (GGDEF)-like protein
MPGSTSPRGNADGFNALAPLAQWMLLESAYRELASPRATRFVPAIFLAAIPAVTGQLWGLAWLLAVMVGLAGGRPVAAAFDRRDANAERAPWVRRYCLVLVSQSACLGAGGLLAAVHGSLPACLLAATAIAFALTEAGVDPFPNEAIRLRIACLATPLAVGAALRAVLLQGGPSFVEMAAIVLVWAGGSTLLARAFASRLDVMAAALPQAPVPVLDSTVTASPGQQDFQRLLGRDQVTGLPNRHSFVRLLGLESERAVLASTPLTLLVVDWIGYAQDADRLPKALVESALNDLANCLRAVLRRRLDVLASLGNGKFALLLPATDAFGGDVVAKAALAAILPESNGGEAAESDGPIRIGCATYRGKGPLVATDLLEFADEALKNARNTQGHAIRHYDHTGKATRPPRFLGEQPKEETRYTDIVKPHLVRSDPTGQKAIFPHKPRLAIDATAAMQDQRAGVLQDQESPQQESAHGVS